jgi:hypothetical protein
MVGDWYLVFGIWYLVFGIWYLVFGIWYLVFGIWYLVFGSGILLRQGYGGQVGGRRVGRGRLAAPTFPPYGGASGAWKK